MENDDGVTVANGLVYLKAVDAIFAFHSADGTQAWKRPETLMGRYTVAGEGFPTLTGNVIYNFDVQPTDPTNPANNPTPYIYAVDAATGAVLWKQAAGSDVDGLLVVDATA